MELLNIILELIGVVSFAISGAMTAIEKQMDAFGVVILGVVTAVGGGVIRDIMIGVTPPQCFRDPIYLIAAAVTAALFFLPFIRKPILRRQKTFDLMLFLTDSIGLAVFAVSGVQAGLQTSGSFHPLLILFVGMVSGTGGSVLRDMMVCQMPAVFCKHVYALAALAGAAVYYALLRLHAPEVPSYIFSAAVVFVLRCLASKFKWNLPKAE